jgi:hypothetical protein
MLELTPARGQPGVSQLSWLSWFLDLSPAVLSYGCVAFKPTLSAPTWKVTDSYFPTGEKNESRGTRRFKESS